VLHEMGEGTPERTILMAVNGILRLRATYTELREQLQKLEEKRRVVGITGEDGERLWKITDDGRAERAEHI
jgi:hypothetical protein